MKVLLSALTLLIASFSSLAQVTPEWISYPAISPDGRNIAFTYKGDIYSVSSTGGEATRLTFHKAHDYKAVWSKDSKSIAFASNRFGNFDIYIMDALGGSAKRLTYHSNDEQPFSFSANSSAILFGAHRMDTAEHRQHPSARFPELYSVSISGADIQQVTSLPVENVDISANGSQFVYQDVKGTENPWRKHHKSAATRDIWTYDTKTSTHTQVTNFVGEDRDPIFSNDQSHIYYLSEQNGTFNVHKLSVNDPSQIQQLTHFTLHPVRFLSAANTALAFTHHGELYTMIEGATPNKLDINIRTQDIENITELLSINGEISEMAISPNGKEIAFISRGDVFVSSTDGRFVKQITQTAVNEASVSFSPKGDYMVYASQRNSKWSIFKTHKVREQEPFFYAATLIEELVLIDNEKDNYQPKISPDGSKIAYVEDRLSIKVMAFDNKKSVTVVSPDNSLHSRDADQHFSWSPDSKWILFQFNKFLHNADIALVNASGNDDMRVLVPSGFFDSSPNWANHGKQIVWLSNREGLKSYATSGRNQNDVYALFLSQSDYDKYSLSKDDFALLEAIEEASMAPEDKADDEIDDEKKANTMVTDITIEWKGVDRRISRLTIHSSDLSDAVLNKDANKLYYLSKFEGDYDLWETDLRSKETKKAISLGAKNGSLMWDTQMESLYLLADGKISTLDLEAGSTKAVNIEQQMLVDHNAVRTASFEHVWLRTSKIFYEPTFHGVDWTLMGAQYRPKVAHVATPQEFAHLLSEMLGELNVSHSGASERSTSENTDSTASLGVFYDYDFSGEGIKISEVISDGPLDKAQFTVESGDIITKIDGQSITKNIDWARLLNRKAGKFVLLDVYNSKSKNSSQITVKPISESDQAKLLYQRFVKVNETEVLARSNGQLGYVHVPNMADGPYRSIYNDMMGRFFDKKGMVIDARFNSGGDLVADLAMFFTGEAFITYATDSRVIGGEPVSRYTKPVISLFNESMYSDGHCYASGYTDLKIGKSVGMPVPGTCSFAGWEMLPMGVRWGVVPWSAKNKAGEWMENNQTFPDVLIKNQAGIIDKGRDQQLERGIDELLETLK